MVQLFRKVVMKMRSKPGHEFQRSKGEEILEPSSDLAFRRALPRLRPETRNKV